MSVIQLSCTITNPQEIGANIIVLPVDLTRHCFFIAEFQTFVRNKQVDSFQCVRVHTTKMNKFQAVNDLFDHILVFFSTSRRLNKVQVPFCSVVDISESSV
ncbi:unnamed protein product [Albugo candida]|uniref:Uncharacterized protein n=1 Tax=Albugo candida TaxID=65357 RepID=A0A024GLS1_9STRA|nr:unnamed protein product [Albugo candida]|eukprot:CCI47686.1 unnamed protein product [Albugo candida]